MLCPFYLFFCHPLSLCRLQQLKRPAPLLRGCVGETVQQHLEGLPHARARNPSESKQCTMSQK